MLDMPADPTVNRTVEDYVGAGRQDVDTMSLCRQLLKVFGSSPALLGPLAKLSKLAQVAIIVQTLGWGLG